MPCERLLLGHTVTVMRKERKYWRQFNKQTERAWSYLRWQNPETESAPAPQRTAEGVQNQQFLFLIRMLSINVRNTSCCFFKLEKASLIERSPENCTSSFLDLSLPDSPSKALNLYNFSCVVLVLVVCMFVYRSVSFSTE